MMQTEAWDIEGYLLDDPSVDREQFEQRMLDDPNLAIQVASAVERLQSVAAVASKSLHAREASVAVAVPGLARVLLALAASVVTVATVWSYWHRDSGQLDAVAAQWVQMRQDPVVSTSQDLIVDADLAGDSEEWLMDSAIAFYSEQGI